MEHGRSSRHRSEVEGNHEAPRPCNVTELRSFLGLISNLASILLLRIPTLTRPNLV